MSDAKEERQHLVTPTGRICFIKNLFSPNNKDKYTATLLLDDSQDLKPLKQLMMKAAREKFKEADIKSKKFKWGVKTPDEEAIDGYEFFTEETVILNAATRFEVEVKGPKKGPDKKYEDILEGDIKAGDFCRFLVSAYPWEFEKTKGVGLNLLAVQMIKEGEALYQRRPSDEFFDEVELDIDLDENGEDSDTVEGDDAFDW